MNRDKKIFARNAQNCGLRHIFETHIRACMIFFIYCNVIVGNPISFIDISQWPKFDIEPDVAKCWPVCSISREKNSCRASLVWIHLRNIKSVGVWKFTIFHRNAAWWCADITHRVPGIQSLHCVVVHTSNLGFN